MSEGSVMEGERKKGRVEEVKRVGESWEKESQIVKQSGGIVGVEKVNVAWRDFWAHNNKRSFYYHKQFLTLLILQILSMHMR